MFLPHPRVKVSIVGSLRDREVACSASDRQGLNFESCVWRTVSSQSSHHPQEVLLAQFSLYVHKGGLKPDSFHLQERIDQRKSTYVSFIDFEKAFDWINRDLLLYNLIMNGIDGKFYFAIKSLYCQTSSCVKLNNILSSSFNTISGVRQGDDLSPTLFNIFRNDLAKNP